eukprot:15302752-Alexandrium_andersonii.AAC.1
MACAMTNSGGSDLAGILVHAQKAAIQYTIDSKHASGRLSEGEVQSRPKFPRRGRAEGVDAGATAGATCAQRRR